MGGDKVSLWSRPAEIAQANREGGWTPEALAESFVPIFGKSLQGPRPAPGS